MEAVTNAVNDELMQSLDYKMRTSNASYVISRKDVNYFPSSLSTITPTTSRVVRAPLTSGSDFIDLESIKVAFRFVQTAAQVASAITTALLPYTDTTGLNSLLAVRDGRLDGAEASISSLQAAGFQTAAQVASAIASALLPYVQQTGLDAALALRDARLDGHDTDILALQIAGPFATSSDLTAAETSLQSAIDAVLAQLAALTTGGGSNLINAQAWSGEIAWDLLLGTNTLRNLHFNAPLSVSLQNEGFTLSLACDSYASRFGDSCRLGSV